MERKNTGFVITIIILVIALLATSGFIVYDKVLNTKNNESQVITNNQEENEENDTKENLYEIFANNIKNNINAKYDENNSNYDYVINNFITDGYSIKLESNGSLYIRYTNDELNKKYGNYKIADNVLSFYLIKTGQSDANMLYYINEDGTVSSADTEYSVANNEDIEIKNNIGNYKDIISIISGDFGNGYSGLRGPIFIDINGNIYSENLN